VLNVGRPKGSGKIDTEEPVTRKVIFPKGGSGSISTKISIPYSWLKAQGITEDDPYISVQFTEEGILVRKIEKDRD
jgi:hypothetical protein